MSPSLSKYPLLLLIYVRQQFNAFAQECQEKSELCQYFMNFQKIVAVIKQLIAADRDGNWPLHVGTVKAFMGILCEFDATISGMHHGTWRGFKFWRSPTPHSTASFGWDILL